MSDPFEALGIDDVPVAPRASFSTELRARLEAELAATPTPAPAPEVRAMNVIPYLSLRNCAAALQFYADAFGAVEEHRIVGDDGRIGHAEIRIGTSKLALADEYPEYGVAGPETRGGPTCQFTIEVADVADVDAGYERALSFGATGLRPPADQFHGNRRATVSDPFGHHWSFSAVSNVMSVDEYSDAARAEGFDVITAGAPDGAHQVKHYDRGDLYYFTLHVADTAKAYAFYGELLGWQFADPAAGHIVNISAPPGAVAPADARNDVQLFLVVDDIHVAVAKVRELGGTAGEPVNYESGWAADCVDDQGTKFSLSVPADQYRS